MTVFNTTLSQLKKYCLVFCQHSAIIKIGSAHDKKIKKSDKTRHNSNFFDELNHAKSYQT